MKKSTLNAIMQGVIIVLVIAIVFVIIQIQIKPKEVIVEPPVSEEESETPSFIEEVSEEPEPEVVVEERARIVNDNINVRSGPGTDYERLGSAYSGYDFELVEQLDSGWTQIIYDGQTAYVYSEYVEIIPMVKQEDGSYTEYVDLENSAETTEQ